MSSPKVFVDTSGFYALLVQGDDRHQAAVAWLAQAREQQWQACTSDYVLDETATLLKAQGWPRLADLLFALLDQSKAITLLYMDEERFEKTKAFFLKRGDRPYSFTDCSSFILMRELGLVEALTKDHHFETAGFRALLK
jgi:predicted nucleic acid-binding protein